MKFTPIEPPRTYEVGFGETVMIADCGRIELAPDEQVTLLTEAGAEYDLTRKEWGFYATPSLNGRLARFGLRGVLVRNRIGRYFVLLVEQGQEAAFERYLSVEALVLVAWLDNDASLQAIAELQTEGGDSHG
ncbi:hypothetical protein HC928_01060 [bacterium]|nr:hypothetical protein [bacterium]